MCCPGYTTFDLAPFYGEVETWMGKLMADIYEPKVSTTERGHFKPSIQSVTRCNVMFCSRRRRLIGS